MLIFKTSGDIAALGEMVCYWEEDAALMTIRALIEMAYRDAAPRADETEIQRAVDELSVKALALLQEYGPKVFYNAKVQLVADVGLQVGMEATRQSSPAGVKLIRRFKEVRKKLSQDYQTKHNEIVGVRRGRQAQVSIEGIIDCLKKLPKSASLTRLAAEMNLPARTLQYILKANGLTFKQAKKNANAQL